MRVRVRVRVRAHSKRPARGQPPPPHSLKAARLPPLVPHHQARFSRIDRKALDIARLPASDDDDERVPEQRWPGSVLETVTVPERDQAPEAPNDDADVFEDPLGSVHCLECGAGDDEHALLLCDGACVCCVSKNTKHGVSQHGFV